MANPLYVPLNVDIGDTSGKLTVPWRQFFQALNGTMGPVATAITQLTGDVTAGPGPGSVAATIANDAVTYAKMQNVSAASRLLGRGSAAGAGNVEEITPGTGLTMSGTTLTATVGTVTNTGTLTDHAVIVGNGGVDVSALASLGTTTTVLHGNASGDPTFGAVSLTADVTGVLPFANGGTLAPVHWAFNTTITNAQFLTLPSTYIEIVAAPGANKCLVPLWAMIHVDADAGAYTGVDAPTQQGLTIAYGDWASDAFGFMSFAGTTIRTMLLPIHAVPNAVTLAAEYPDLSLVFLQENQPLKLVAWNALDYTGGNAANSFRIGVAYSIVNFTTGVFS